MYSKEKLMCFTRLPKPWILWFKNYIVTNNKILILSLIKVFRIKTKECPLTWKNKILTIIFVNLHAYWDCP